MSRSQYIFWNHDDFFEINDFNVRIYLQNQQEVLGRLSKAAECAFAQKMIKSLNTKISQKLETIQQTRIELDLTEYQEILNSVSKQMKRIIDYFELKMFH